MSDRQPTFDHDYWDEHYAGPGVESHAREPHPYVVRETADLTPGTVLDAGCGEGVEASWLAEQGWDVTAADIASEALRRARGRTAPDTLGRVCWVEADLAVWEPAVQLDLVTTCYAHPTIPQLDFYDRLAGWVAPGGTLLVVGHGRGRSHGHGHGQGAREGPPPAATVTAASVAARFDPELWEVVTVEDVSRVLVFEGGEKVIDDVVVRATRRALLDQEVRG